MFTVIVAGWRGATAEQHGLIVINELTDLHMRYGGQVLMRHGRCPYGGVDLISDTVGRTWGWEIDAIPPEITSAGRILGDKRNQVMCRKGGDLCLAFPGPGSIGTWSCIKWAAHYKIRCHLIPLTK